MHKSGEVGIFAFKRSATVQYLAEMRCNILALSSVLFPLRTLQIYIADIRLKFMHMHSKHMNSKCGRLIAKHETD